MTTFYNISLVALLVLGLVAAAAFLGTHRPKNWRRLAAVDASGWVVIFALLMVRSLLSLAQRWPPRPPESWTQAGISIGLLALVDALLIIRILSYRAFVARTHEGQHRRDGGKSPAPPSSPRSVEPP